jgi:transcriptional regulator with XRE-family HTH domain
MVSSYDYRYAPSRRAMSRSYGGCGMSLGELVRELRQRRGWTQEQLAEATGMDQTSISQIETGRTLRPSYERMLGLAAALAIPVADLLQAAGLAGDVAQNGRVDGFDRYEGEFVGWLRTQPRMRDELEEVRQSRGEKVYRDYLRALWSAWEANFRATMAALRLGEGGDVT